MHWLVYVSVLLACSGLVLLVLLYRQGNRRAKRRFVEILEARSHAAWMADANQSIAGHGAELLQRMSRRRDQSVELTLHRAGWTTPLSRTLYYTAAALTPIAGLIAGGAWGILRGEPSANVLALAFLGFGAGYLLPHRILGWRAQRRQKALAEEVLPVVHLLRMLSDAGLSLEHTLRVINQQARELVPEMAAEIGIALRRINASQEPEMALEEMAALFQVAELNDAVAIFKQATRHGGNVRESLIRLAQLIEDRRVTSLREYVSKLSAKMTVVMVIFMFPALILFLAGPGFVAVARGLLEVR